MKIPPQEEQGCLYPCEPITTRPDHPPPTREPDASDTRSTNCTPKVWLDYLFFLLTRTLFSISLTTFAFSQNISISLAHVPALPKPPRPESRGKKAAHASANSFLFLTLLPSLAVGFLWRRRRRARGPRYCTTTALACSTMAAFLFLFTSCIALHSDVNIGTKYF